MIAGDVAEVHQDDLVHRLRLAICLGMKGHAEVELATGKPEEITPDIACEHGVPVVTTRS